MGLKGITDDPINCDIKAYFDESSSWVEAATTETTLGGLKITGYTPALSGDPDHSYQFIVNIGIPPADV